MWTITGLGLVRRFRCGDKGVDRFGERWVSGRERLGRFGVGISCGWLGGVKTRAG